MTDQPYQPFIVERDGIKYIRVIPFKTAEYYPMFSVDDKIIYQGAAIIPMTFPKVESTEFLTNLNVGCFRGKKSYGDPNLVLYFTNLIDSINGIPVIKMTDELAGYNSKPKEQKTDKDGNLTFNFF